MRGQISIELLTTIGMLITFTIPVLLLLLTVSQYGQENAAMAQADTTVRLLSENIDIIYFEGDGAKKAVLINLPSNTKAIAVSGFSKQIVLNISTSAGSYEAATPFYGKINGDYIQNDKRGLVTVTLENIGGEVYLS